MKIFDADISLFLIDFFNIHFLKIKSFQNFNVFLREISGIESFFRDPEEFVAFKCEIEEYQSLLKEPNRRAYGDFQTNERLADRVIQYLIENGTSPEILVEPTCGKGTFILSALKHFQALKKIVGIEIYYPYVWETKFKILELYLKNESISKVHIEIIHADIFDYDLTSILKESEESNLLVIGNPPWVTNSELGILNANNLPKKSNFKKYSGIDAITGKGNFDIAEYITLKIFNQLSGHTGSLAFLVKNSVVKNILFDQKKLKYKIKGLQQLNINAKKEFNVSVDACLFLAEFDSNPEFICKETDFYSRENITKFGWWEDKFVYSIIHYKKAKSIDGESPFIWRQGMKHDCSKIMELDKFNGHYINGFKEEVDPEAHLLFGILKSSDLKEILVDKYRKTTIVTQRKIGQDTSYIKRDYPKTYEYLNANREFFDKRKSSIYRGKPPFSIFGIGDYSFSKYKIAISGMYKRTTFSLVVPENDKPLMLDDTCYFIGFDSLEMAQVAQEILNDEVVQNFLRSIIFPNAKRPITKDVLMRIDIQKAYDFISMDKDIRGQWKEFGELLKLKNKTSAQMTLF